MKPEQTFWFSVGKPFDNTMKMLNILDKRDFILKWVNPQKSDYILECGSSSGKTAISLARNSGCKVLGVDIDKSAITTSKRILKEYYPHLNCDFIVGDLATIKINPLINKVLMLDFTEHINDNDLKKIFSNINKQIPFAKIYIYTPNKSYFLINKIGLITEHINLKTESELNQLLKECNLYLLNIKRLPSFIPLFKYIEQILYFPIFHRKLALVVVMEFKE